MTVTAIPPQAAESNESDAGIEPRPGTYDPIEAWTRAWLALGGSFTMDGRGRQMLGQPEPHAMIGITGLPKLPPDFPPHLAVYSADEWRGAFRALELMLHMSDNDSSDEMMARGLDLYGRAR